MSFDPLTMSARCISAGVGSALTGEARKFVQHRYVHSHEEIQRATVNSVIDRIEKGSDYDMLRTGMIKILYELQEIRELKKIPEDKKVRLSDTPIGPFDYAIKRPVKNCLKGKKNPFEDCLPSQESDSDSELDSGNEEVRPQEIARGLSKSKNSKWIDHVKAHAKKHKLSYKDALKKAKESYKK